MLWLVIWRRYPCIGNICSENILITQLQVTVGNGPHLLGALSIATGWPHFMVTILVPFRLNTWWDHLKIQIHFPLKFWWSKGDEIEVLNDTWLFLIWVSDHSPFHTNSACSRWPIAVLPKSLYLMDEESGVNLTVAAATREIVASFNKLSNDGIKLRDVPSMGAREVSWFCFHIFFWNGDNGANYSVLCPFPSYRQSFSNGIAKVARFKFFCMGFRGDWKAFVQVFNLSRFYNTEEVRVVAKIWQLFEIL